MQKVRPTWPSDIAPVSDAPAVNCELANRFMDTSGVSPRAVRRCSQAKNPASSTMESEARMGTIDRPNGEAE